ncbi:hypothetical protein K2173_012975 [Erythroxylum novogranatense]|uniref:non-specific serine/threonine protein kinase n=1 Tax=Erythroxylum novogranatense TaxID=1862640 RepID=A0AAV8S4Q2_9ROSI|nr:hypothetical protein K2173_012975 [Erythroxylum novogranatense]
MSCFSCFSSHGTKSVRRTRSNRRAPPPATLPTKEQYNAPQPWPENQKTTPPPRYHNTNKDDSNRNITAQTFTFRELATATRNFRHECLIGEGGFGRVYKGKLEKTGQVVAVKQLDRNGLQGNREFLVEVLMLSLLHHSNLVNLIGYCADGDQRLLVYSIYISREQKPLEWFTRMKIALGAAKGLEYLHDKANPPVIYRDLKASNILLDKDYNARLSDFGLAKLGPVGDKTHYQRTGQLTTKSDVYSFGVVLLELITGRRVIDTTRSTAEQNLVSWAEPIFKETSRFAKLADPLLRGHFPIRGLNQAVAVAAMCLQEDANVRPLMSDVVSALSFLGPDANGTPISLSSPPSYESEENEDVERQQAVEEAIEWGASKRQVVPQNGTPSLL